MDDLVSMKILMQSTQSDLLSFTQNYRLGTFKIFVVKTANIGMLLNQYLGDLPNNKNGQIEYQIHPDVKKIHRVSNDEKKLKVLDKDCPSVFNRHHPDFLKGRY